MSVDLDHNRNLGQNQRTKVLEILAVDVGLTDRYKPALEQRLLRAMRIRGETVESANGLVVGMG